VEGTSRLDCRISGGGPGHEDGNRSVPRAAPPAIGETIRPFRRHDEPSQIKRSDVRAANVTLASLAYNTVFMTRNFGRSFGPPDEWGSSQLTPRRHRSALLSNASTNTSFVWGPENGKQSRRRFAAPQKYARMRLRPRVPAHRTCQVSADKNRYPELQATIIAIADIRRTPVRLANACGE
jgi:hypothetical protein